MGNVNELTTPRGGEADRVRVNTSEEVNARLDREMRERVEAYASKGYAEITRRIEELDRERYALKALRGYFSGVETGGDGERRAGEALDAVSR